MMGKRARQKVFSDFSAEKMVEEIASLYESSLFKKGFPSSQAYAPQLG